MNYDYPYHWNSLMNVVESPQTTFSPGNPRWAGISNVLGYTADSFLCKLVGENGYHHQAALRGDLRIWEREQYVLMLDMIERSW